MKKSSKFLIAGFLAGIFFTTPFQAAALGLGMAENFNTFIFGNFVGSSDTEGRLAVGGDATLLNYSVGDKLAPDAYQDTLIVGGDLTANYGRVYYGNALVGGTASIQQTSGYADNAVIEGATIPIDFAAEAAYLKSKAVDLAKLDANGSVKSEWGALSLSGDGQSNVQVFNLEGKALLNANGFDLSNIADDATVIFNVSGDIAGLTNMSLNALLPYRDKVLFNFYEASSLTLSGISVEGSVLAPFAEVENPQGVIQGTIVAASWDGAMQQNHVTFTGDLPDSGVSVPVPESSTLLLLAAGMFALLSYAGKVKK